jgi:hypothetical protein
MAKTPAKKTVRKPKADPAIEAEAIKMASTSDPQSGGAQIRDATTPSAAEVKAAKKAALEEQFGAANAKGSPSADELEEIRVGLQIRGY